ncbi:cytochrome c, class I [Thioalkalivibrio sulfidiphilus HL-EbGr7]|uniref:Cytochrome c, class I n=1 Tax=Thioalkalivibrio sulfidiphilus (strain HL-EbGR7) TaxID=396588 RepID=B8GSB6_THISH|nr:c-type cytochrome [Thioalkalivibrio sulfidiphilus]ACL72820.1 cytochrome c, class I [Thioalkalivibrio sulfidiphilus HL-EbGr7]
MKFKALTLIVPVALTLSLVSGTALAEEGPSRGALLAATCFSCHGPMGQSNGSMPSLAGYPRDVMVSQMQAFRDGTRPGTVMPRHAKGYTDEEFELMADYIANM